MAAPSWMMVVASILPPVAAAAPNGFVDAIAGIGDPVGRGVETSGVGKELVVGGSPAVVGGGGAFVDGAGGDPKVPVVRGGVVGGRSGLEAVDSGAGVNAGAAFGGGVGAVKACNFPGYLQKIYLLEGAVFGPDPFQGIPHPQPPSRYEL